MFLVEPGVDGDADGVARDPFEHEPAGGIVESQDVGNRDGFATAPVEDAGLGENAGTGEAGV